MISEEWLGDGFVALVCWSLVCWMLGVGWAAYRAVGWIERMRAWAASCESPEAVTGFVPAGGDDR